jgi:hypothetical protein
MARIVCGRCVLKANANTDRSLDVAARVRRESTAAPTVRCKAKHLTLTELSALLVHGRVHRALNDAEQNLLYDFDTTYTLGRFDDRLKITSVVVHNEIPRYRACLARLLDPTVRAPVDDAPQCSDSVFGLPVRLGVEGRESAIHQIPRPPGACENDDLGTDVVRIVKRSDGNGHESWHSSVAPE